MKDRSLSLNGISHQEQWSKVFNGSEYVWQKSDTYFPSLKYIEDFSTFNGESGNNFKSPTRMGFLKTVYVFGNGYSISGDQTNSYIVNEGVGVTGPTQGGLPGADLDFTDIYNQALDNLNSQNRGNLDLSVDLLESSQVLRMVRNATKLVTFVQRFKPKYWASNWLELQYGWKPLVSSMYESANLFNSRIRDGLSIYNARASSSESKVYVLTPLPGRVDRWERFVSKRVEIKIRMLPAQTILDDLSRLSSLNPASIAWELVPFSFVADWVFDLGSYLRNMETAFVGSPNFLDGYVTYGYLYRDIGSCHGEFISGPGSSTTYNGNTIFRQSYKSRNVLTDYPRPVFPNVKFDLGASRITSAASLLYQRFKR